MPLSRKKSCMRCRQSKLRCNQATPTCSRCSERGVSCIYDWKVGYGSSSSVSRASRTSTTSPRIFEELSDNALQSQDSSDIPDLPASVFMNPPHQVAGLEPGDIEVDWNAINTADDQSFDVLKLSPSLGLPTMPAPYPIWAGTQGLADIGVETPGIDTMNSMGAPQNNVSAWFMGRIGVSSRPDNSSCTISPESVLLRPPLRTFQLRHVLKSCALTRVVIGQLTSFPKMMTHGDRLPPFISPPCYLHEELAFDCAKNRRHKCLPKELAICAGLVDMFYSRTPQNADFVWKTIYAEKDRLHREIEDLDPHHQLAALQATIIYALLQAHDVESSDANGGYSLMRSVLEIAMALSKTSRLETNILDGVPDRQQWIHEESIRRTIVLIIVIDLMLDGLREPLRSVAISLCAFHLHLIPLPATRDLWEAHSNFIWRTEFERYLSKRKTKKALTIGDLLALDDSGTLRQLQPDDPRSDILPDILSWCEGVDSFGSLLWMVVPFHQWRAQAGMDEVW
ncbi:hypothetical protein BGW36DRAFT_357651 [Talaromyces proteolyticus]|uniref:Zn(2)-C6 fungal-type domain-containing protein n=1 Tax=Talaromyces proteolyticus TaxID=1131652 RepID=A0AAD4KZL4_9EURO|nr:uncharacterized protein BGW36DRAFT_357651 [Talaromyces proteolyticus]KAH8701021.1 hypothetical protein BGW36DRAFT_357651 [Talaromyces proteolyticus]